MKRYERSINLSCKVNTQVPTPFYNSIIVYCILIVLVVPNFKRLIQLFLRFHDIYQILGLKSLTSIQGHPQRISLCNNLMCSRQRDFTCLKKQSNTRRNLNILVSKKIIIIIMILKKKKKSLRHNHRRLFITTCRTFINLSPQITNISHQRETSHTQFFQR